MLVCRGGAGRGAEAQAHTVNIKITAETRVLTLDICMDYLDRNS
ncbi:MAG: hypothetical protein NT024_14730 [Proteobacteria bacterium]|nr:hypothetical protein [Pseudomonadota bacterium]